MRIKRHIANIHRFDDDEKEAKYAAIGAMLRHHSRQSFWIGLDPRAPHLILISYGRDRCHIPVKEAERFGIADLIGDYSPPGYCPVR